jgi:hypothetical protein
LLRKLATSIVQDKAFLAWQCYFGFFSIFFHKGTMPLLTSMTMPRDAKHNGTPMINPSAIHTRLVVKIGKADIIEDKISFFPFSGLISVKYRLIVEYVLSWFCCDAFMFSTLMFM